MRLRRSTNTGTLIFILASFGVSPSLATDQYNSLVSNINKSLIDQRIYLPSGNNALEYLNQLIHLDENKQSKTIKDNTLKVSRAFLVMATKEIADANFSIAALHIAKSKMLTPNLPLIKSVEELILQKESQIASEKTNIKNGGHKVEDEIIHQSMNAIPSTINKENKSEIKNKPSSKNKKPTSKVIVNPPKTTKHTSLKPNTPRTAKITNTAISLPNKILLDNTETIKPFKKYDLQQIDIDQKSLALKPLFSEISREIIRKNASVIIRTSNIASYRWLTVKLKVATHKISKKFKLRHQYKLQPQSSIASIELIPYREKALFAVHKE